ncbi:MAG: hypothetical protein NTY19_07910 [Planctomycetota bacterium]|nr:hypothetical protein [Planctomycetota bacterium]
MGTAQPTILSKPLRGVTQAAHVGVFASFAACLLMAAANGFAAECDNPSASAESMIKQVAPPALPADQPTRTSAKSQAGRVPLRFTDRVPDAGDLIRPEPFPKFYSDYVGDKKGELRIVRMDQEAPKTIARDPWDSLLRYVPPPVFVPDKETSAAGKPQVIPSVCTTPEPVGDVNASRESDHLLTLSSEFEGADAKVPASGMASILRQGSPAVPSHSPVPLARDTLLPSPAAESSAAVTPTVISAAPFAIYSPPAAPVPTPAVILAAHTVTSPEPSATAAATAAQVARSTAPTVIGAAPLTLNAAGIVNPDDDGIDMAHGVDRHWAGSHGGQGSPKLLAWLAQSAAEQAEAAKLPPPARLEDRAGKPIDSQSAEPPEVADGHEEHEEVAAPGVDPGFLRMDQLTMRIDLPVEKDNQGKSLPTPEDHAQAYFAKQGATAAELQPYSYWMEKIGYGPALNFCYNPLYFEEVNLERYGNSLPIVQPAVSAARFFGTMAILPYRLTAYRPHRCLYHDHHFRPGAAAPCEHAVPWLRVDASLMEAYAIAGLIFLIP